jgi:hypothetical protein
MTALRRYPAQGIRQGDALLLDEFTQDMRDFAAKQGVSEQEAPK